MHHIHGEVRDGHHPRVRRVRRAKPTTSDADAVLVPPPITYAHEHGTITVGPVVYVERGSYIRYDVWTPHDGTGRVGEDISCTGPSDVSGWHHRSDGYDARCASCYLHFGHTRDDHARSLGEWVAS